MADIFEDFRAADARRALFLLDEKSGLNAMIAIDSLALGPAFGGIRTRAYPSVGEALTDAQNLAKAMTLKCAIAGLPGGGAKTVVLDHAGLNRPEAFSLLGRYIEDLGGLYYAGGDLGTTETDLAHAAKQTSYVNTNRKRLGDATASTVVNGIRAFVDHSGGTMQGVRVGVQGCGMIGEAVVRMLASEGAEIILADIDRDRAAELAAEVDARTVSPEALLSADVDILSPCAAGGTITEQVASEMTARAVCGGANNQLSSEKAGRILHDRGIAFVPDFLSSSGAVIDGACQSLGEVDPEPLIAATYNTAKTIFERAEAEGSTPTEIAREIAMDRVQKAADR